MKLNILHTESSCGWGGQELRILGESEGFIAEGHKVTIVCPEHAPIYAAAQKRGIPVFPVPIERKNIKGLLAAYRWLKSNPPMIINTHSSTDSWLFTLASRWLSKRPAVVRSRHVSAPVHDNWPTTWLYAKGADYIVTTGDALRDYLTCQARFAKQKVVSIPTGLEINKYPPAEDKGRAKTLLGLPVDRPVIGKVAIMRDWKGHRYLVDAFAELLKSGKSAHLLLVGGGEEFENVQKQIADLGIGEHVTLTGTVDNVLDYLHAMDLFVLASYDNEGVPQSIMQAMLTGLPIVATDVGSVREIVVENKTGLMAPPKNVQAMTDAMRQMVSDRERLRTMGLNARQFGEERFSRELMVERMEKVFTEAYASLSDR
ncbi:Glycosyltransferase [Hahella chejuensis KCTC 2396]|uniref:Glycosyltransferase n=1 Tax=Hahella chejuensis (strain KCTC 2396) TaxID=349521 RepID=Q2SN38_HAHCH|nr:glycosyltransferase [Hahella chejuensis]ABC27936.1 Glycosyltransferase [Hahella chejuensis KCTC 2396]